MKFESYLIEGDVIDIKGKLVRKRAQNLIDKVSQGFDMQNKAEADSMKELQDINNMAKKAFNHVKVVGFNDIGDMSYFLVNTHLFMQGDVTKRYNELSNDNKRIADFILKKGSDFIKVAEDLKRKYEDFVAKWKEKRDRKEYTAKLDSINSVGYITHALYNDIRIVKDFIRRVKK